MTLGMKNCLRPLPFSGRLAAGAMGAHCGDSLRGVWRTHRGFFSVTHLLRSPGVRVDGELLYGALGKSRRVRSFCLHIYSTTTRGNWPVFVTEKTQGEDGCENMLPVSRDKKAKPPLGLLSFRGDSA